MNPCMSGVEARVCKENWIIAQLCFYILLKLTCCICLPAALPHNLLAAFEREIKLCSSFLQQVASNFLINPQCLWNSVPSLFPRQPVALPVVTGCCPVLWARFCTHNCVSLLVLPARAKQRFYLSQYYRKIQDTSLCFSMWGLSIGLPHKLSVFPLVGYALLQENEDWSCAI